jgi:hypothetical protein
MNFLKAADFEIFVPWYDDSMVCVDSGDGHIMGMTREVAFWVADAIRFSLSHSDRFGVRFADTGLQFTVTRRENWIVIALGTSHLALKPSEAKILSQQFRLAASKLSTGPGATGLMASAGSAGA